MNLKDACQLVRWTEPLPPNYGQGENDRCIERPLANERCIELPLALEVAQLDQPGLVLDAGCSLNRADVWSLSIAGMARLWHYGQSLTAESIPAGRRKDRMSYLCGDLRHLELADETCDRIVCVSTLEHIGMDNRQYGGALESAPLSMFAAVVELWRVLKPGGTMFLSFPCGREPQQCGGRYRTLGPGEVAQIDHLTAGHAKTRYFLRSPKGWIDADASIACGLADGGKPVLGLCCIRAEK